MKNMITSSDDISVQTKPVPTKLRLGVFIGMTIFILLVRLGLTGAIPGLLAPWVIIPGFTIPEHTPELHVWHGAEWGTFVVILSSGSLLSLLRKPLEKVILVQFVSFAWLFLFLIPLVFDIAEIVPYFIICVVPIIAIILTYPIPKNVFQFHSIKVKSPLFVLTVISGILLLGVGVHDLLLQINGLPTDEHVNRMDWGKSFGLSITFIVGSLLSCTQKPGWKPLTFLLGLSFVYLGLSAFATASAPGSWGIIGGIASLIIGIAYWWVLLRKKVVE